MDREWIQNRNKVGRQWHNDSKGQQVTQSAFIATKASKISDILVLITVIVKINK
jgi:hypothetical protein